MTWSKVSSQSPAHCLYCVQYEGLFSCLVHSVNHPGNGETGEYFCIYCTFVTKKRADYLFRSIKHVKYHLLCLSPGCTDI